MRQIINWQDASNAHNLTHAFVSVIVFIAYIYLTVKSFHSLPAVPSLEDVINTRFKFADSKNFVASTSHSSTSTASVISDTKAKTKGVDPNQNLIADLAKQTPFPQSMSLDLRHLDTSKSDQLETIVHPAVELLPSLAKNNEIDNLVVPKFYDPPIFQPYGGIRSYLGYGQRLMTLTEAKTIGSYVKLEHDNVAVDPLETIFVAIASYRDFQCQQTVESIFTRATHPERVRIAVVDQLDLHSDTPCSQPEVPCTQNPNQIVCKYKDQIDFYEMDARFAVGPVFARHLGYRMYRGEYFAMQCDAHVDFIRHWDSRIIQEWKSAKNEMAVLTTYMSDVNGAMDEKGNLKVFSRPIMCKSGYEGYGATKHLRHGQQPEGVTQIKGEPSFEPFWAAGFSFSRGHFVINIPYDQHLPWVFQGEEISIGLRGFTYGYDYYAPQHSVSFHYYAARDKTGKRNKTPLFWEHSETFKKDGNVVEKKGMMRLNGILNMNPPNIKDDQWLHTDEKQYGLGEVRTTQKFFDTFGIDTVHQTTEDHLCKFVGKKMQRMWKPHIRSDTMGVNYDQITFRFTDPDKK